MITRIVSYFFLGMLFFAFFLAMLGVKEVTTNEEYYIFMKTINSRFESWSIEIPNIPNIPKVTPPYVPDDTGYTGVGKIIVLLANLLNFLIDVVNVLIGIINIIVLILNVVIKVIQFVLTLLTGFKDLIERLKDLNTVRVIT